MNNLFCGLNAFQTIYIILVGILWILNILEYFLVNLWFSYVWWFVLATMYYEFCVFEAAFCFQEANLSFVTFVWSMSHVWRFLYRFNYPI